ncbi:protein rapunzel-like [Erpetoichthys calabaricus]|uniref:Rapunzel 4 n=1 Tax=Erpetoichthys calabaricus TaxID=27687 RepID=A0A8C4T174_ERPCA|nr:protein rapunzel-like [Erpetoichthys calabaricus]XP_051778781.1 protein rapunzel-like [Erpetoichthys calabaricus]
MDKITKDSEHQTDINKIMSKVLKGSQFFLEVIGEVVPICSAAAEVIKSFQDNSESPQIGNLKIQIQQIDEKLNDITENYKQVNKEIQKLPMDVKFSKIEENIKGQYMYYTKIVDEEPKYRDKRIEDFCDLFPKLKGESNLNELYDGVMGNGEIDILETVKNYWNRDRRVMEEFCAHLGYLFLTGISASMVYASLKGLDVSKREKEWSEKMTAVQSQMVSAIEYCKNNFEDQAKTDLETFIKKSHHQLLVENLCSFLEKKYDWVKWSVKVYSHPKDKKKGTNDCIIGNRHFTFSDADDLQVVVSYCTVPCKIDMEQIQQTFTEKTANGNMKELAEAINEKMPNSLVHVIKSSKKITEKNNFSKHCYYYKQNKNCHLFVHC